MTDAPFDPLTEEESVDLAVVLDNVEELLRCSFWVSEEHAAQTKAYRDKLRKWVDRLCE